MADEKVNGAKAPHRGNTFVLICTPCMEFVASGKSDGNVKFALELGSRGRKAFYETQANGRAIDLWLWEHKDCGGKNHPDHFDAGYVVPRDHDQPKDAPLEDAVKLALVN